MKSPLLDTWQRLNPASRTTDPQTSHKAEAQMNLGPRQYWARQVLSLVGIYPNCTAAELSIHMWQDSAFDVGFRQAADTPRKRLNDLLGLRLVDKGPVRKCSDSGREAATWHITDKGRRELESE